MKRGSGCPTLAGPLSHSTCTWPGGKVTSLRMAVSAAPEQDAHVDMPAWVSLKETPLETEQYWSIFFLLAAQSASSKVLNALLTNSACLSYWLSHMLNTFNSTWAAGCIGSTKLTPTHVVSEKDERVIFLPIFNVVRNQASVWCWLHPSIVTPASCRCVINITL